MTSIYFNNQNIFSGLAPTPLVSLSIEPIRYDRKWVDKYLIRLNGTLTGSFCDTFSGIRSKQNQLIEKFNQSIGTFEIKTNISGEELNFVSDSAKVNSINFEDSSYKSTIPFTVDIECYDNNFLATSGIVDPSRTISFQSSDDGSVVVDYEVSAKGLRNASGLGLDRAVQYVQSLTGISNVISFAPILIPASNHGFLLTNQSENFNRFENTYSVKSTYTYDANDTNSGNASFLKYNVDIQSGSDNGFIQCSVNGSLSKYIKNDPNLLLYDFQAIVPYELANNYFNRFYSGSLNLNPTSFEVNLDNFNGVLNFNYLYDNNPQDLIIISPIIQINSELFRPISASIETTFKYRGNCLCNNEDGWNALVNESLVYDYYSPVVSKLSQYGFTGSLNSAPISYSTVTDKNNCSIKVSKSFGELKYSFSDELESFGFKVGIKPSILKYSASPTIASGVWYIQNLGNRTRTTYSINGNARIKDCVDINEGLEIVKIEINQLAGQIVVGNDKILESASFTQSEENPRLVDFNFSWSAMSTQFIV